MQNGNDEKHHSRNVRGDGMVDEINHKHMTERQDAISKLQRDHERLRAFMQTNTEPIWCVEFDQPIALDLPEEEQVALVYKYSYVSEANEAYARAAGLENVQEAVGWRLKEFMPPSIPQNLATIQAMVRARYTLSDFETVESYNDGVTRNYLNNMVGIIEAGYVVRWWGTSRDITAQKELEKGLRTSEERYELAVAGSDAGIWDWDILSGTIYYSQRFKTLLGYKSDEFPETLDAFFDRLHPEDAETVRAALDRHLQDRVPYDIEYRLRTHAETYRWFHARGQAIWDESEQAVRMSGSIHDVTRRKQSEQQLKAAYTEIEQLKHQLQEENIYLQEEINQLHHVEHIVGQHSGMKHALYKVEEIAPTDIAVLILGETGTGKEVFARAIHHVSPRKAHPLVKVNCAALSATLIESELFGHEKGAFTGADRQRKGRFELADGATLFLDEIGELSLELQAKLLQVLQNGEFERLGGNKTLTVDVRILAATNRVLTTEVQQGRFRKDLYYRLNKYSITIPPLRERPDDIPLLVTHHLKHVERSLGKAIRTIPTAVMQALQRYSWPGNVRELENVIERAVLAARGDTLSLPEPLQDPALPSAPSSSSESAGSPATTTIAAIARRGTLEEVEREYTQQILQACHWRIAGPKGAAVILGLHPNTLRARLRKLGLQRPL